MNKKLLSLFLGVSFFAHAACAEGDIKGTWNVTKMEPAPWLASKPDSSPYYAEELEDGIVVFGEDKLTAPISWMGCKKPKYEKASVPFNGLFEGGLEDKERGLTDAAGLAHKLGFTKEPVTSVTPSCSELTYHFADDNTLLFALDNVIYTLSRAKDQPRK